MDQDEFDVALSELELRLERLRALYEQYFLGIERIEPGVARKDVDRRFWQIRKVKVRNTAKRFKLQNLFQRYNTLQQYWTKVCRQIEAGTYVRHVARLRRRELEGIGGEPLPPPGAAPRPPTPATATPLPTRTAADAPRPNPVDREFQTKVERLHRELVATEQQLRPGSQSVSLKALAESLKMTEAKLRHKHAGKRVDFQVVVREGRAAIKPVIRVGEDD